MDKISKIITNVLVIKGDHDGILKFTEEIKANGIRIIEVKCPKKLQDITTEFVDQEWKILYKSLKNKIIYGKYKENEIIIGFSNENLQHILIEQIENYKLNATYKYLFDCKNTSSIFIEEYKNGYINDESFSDRFNRKNYTVAKCFA